MSNSTKTVSLLRQRMIDDMTLRKLNDKTQISYIRAVKRFARFFKQSPELASPEDLRAFQKHLGAKIGFTSVLHTWGSALTHHPHVHCIVPGGGLAADGKRWKPCKQGFFLLVRVLSRLFRKLFLAGLTQAHRDGRLQFFGKHKALSDRSRFAAYLSPTTKIDWVVYAKPPFAGPDAVLNYLSRYTHRIAISNRRLVSHTEQGVTFRWKDYRIKRGDRFKSMTLSTDEFIRRFLIHVLPSGFHRIRHYGLFASHVRRGNLERIRQCLKIPPEEKAADAASDSAESSCAFVCRSCGAPLVIIETLNPKPRAPPT